MPAFRRRWSTANVRALMDDERAWPRYELLGGELFMTPAPGNRHQLVVSEIHRLVGDYTESQQVGVAFASPADLELQHGSITQPERVRCSRRERNAE